MPSWPSAERRVLLCVGGVLSFQGICRVMRSCAFCADANKRFWYIPVKALFAQSSRCLISILLAHIGLRQIAVVLYDPLKLNKKISHFGGNSDAITRRAAHVLSIERNAKMQFGLGIGQLVTRLDKF